MYLINVYKNTGLSKEKNNPYSLPRCTVLQEFEDVNRERFQSTGIGFIPVELAVSESFFDTLFKFYRDNGGADKPVFVALKTKMNSEGKNLVVGFSVSPAQSNVDQSENPSPVFGGKKSA